MYPESYTPALHTSMMHSPIQKAFATQMPATFHNPEEGGIDYSKVIGLSRSTPLCAQLTPN